MIVYLIRATQSNRQVKKLKEKQHPVLSCMVLGRHLPADQRQSAMSVILRDSGKLLDYVHKSCDLVYSRTAFQSPTLSVMWKMSFV